MIRSASILALGILLGAALVVGTGPGPLTASSPSAFTGVAQSRQADADRLAVVWTSGDRDVALKMVFMYVYNGMRNEWWEEIALIVWGPSSKLLSEDVELQEQIAMMQEVGVEVVACRACAEQYGVDEKLEEMGIEVVYMGRPLTAMLKSEWEVVTF
jgi:hypothetical protein